MIKNEHTNNNYYILYIFIVIYKNVLSLPHFLKGLKIYLFFKILYSFNISTNLSKVLILFDKFEVGSKTYNIVFHSGPTYNDFQNGQTRRGTDK